MVKKEAKPSQGFAHPLGKPAHTGTPKFTENHGPSIFQCTRDTMANGKQVSLPFWSLDVHSEGKSCVKGNTGQRRSRKGAFSPLPSMYMELSIKGASPTHELLLPTGNREDRTLKLYREEQVRREDTRVPSISLSVILGSRLKNLRMYQGRQ